MRWRRAEASRPWFVERDQRFGVGWTPATPEGWAVTAAFCLLIVVGAGLMRASHVLGLAFLAALVLLAEAASVAGRDRR